MESGYHILSKRCPILTFQLWISKKLCVTFRISKKFTWPSEFQKALRDLQNFKKLSVTFRISKSFARPSEFQKALRDLQNFKKFCATFKICNNKSIFYTTTFFSQTKHRYSFWFGLYFLFPFRPSRLEPAKPCTLGRIIPVISGKEVPLRRLLPSTPERII